MNKKPAKEVAKKAAIGASKFVGGAIGTAAIPATMGVMDWRVLAAAAAVGGLGGLFGVDVAKMAKQKMTKVQTP